jgi:hypothetical protein
MICATLGNRFESADLPGAFMLSTPGALDQRVTPGAPQPHTAKNYRQGCKCPACREEHNREQAAYAVTAYHRRKNELASLREFYATVAAAQELLDKALAR